MSFKKMNQELKRNSSRNNLRFARVEFGNCETMAFVAMSPEDAALSEQIISTYGIRAEYLRTILITCAEHSHDKSRMIAMTTVRRIRKFS